jgi:hypothetical protein
MVCEAVIEHMRSIDEVYLLLQGIFDNLTPGGCLILRFPDIGYGTVGSFYDSPDHTFPCTLRRICEYCRETGFEIAQAGYSTDGMGFVMSTLVGVLCRLWQGLMWWVDGFRGRLGEFGRMKQIAQKEALPYIVAVKPEARSI